MDKEKLENELNGSLSIILVIYFMWSIKIMLNIRKQLLWVVGILTIFLLVVAISAVGARAARMIILDVFVSLIICCLVNSMVYGLIRFFGSIILFMVLMYKLSSMSNMVMGVRMVLE